VDRPERARRSEGAAVSIDPAGRDVAQFACSGVKRRAARRAHPLLAAALLAISLAGCATDGTQGWETTATVQDPDDVKYYPSDEPYRLGVEQFNRGHHGLAERYFRDAVESAPKDASAWIGLAASYDRIQRFDLADRAQFLKSSERDPNNPYILNNLRLLDLSHRYIQRTP